MTRPANLFKEIEVLRTLDHLSKEDFRNLVRNSLNQWNIFENLFLGDEPRRTIGREMIGNFSTN